MSRPITRVLVLETDTDRAATLGDELTSDAETVLVDHVHDVDVALERVAQQRYDCVVFDVALHDPGPVELIGALHRVDGRLAVVVVASLAEDAALVEAVRAGADGHLTKGHLEGPLVRRAVRLAVARKRVESELVHRSLYDRVTGLMNRLALDELLPATLNRADRRGTRIGAIFVDLPGLEALADRQTDEVVDSAVVEVADRLQVVARDSDLIARVAPTQFVVICEDLSADRGVRHLATRIEQSLATPIDLRSGEPVALAATLRLASADGATSPADLMRANQVVPDAPQWLRR